MFLNRLRQGLQSIAGKTLQARLALISVEEKRFSHLLSPETNTALMDMRKCEILWKKTKTSIKIHNHLYDCFSQNISSPSYIVSIMRVACANRNFPTELMFNLISAYNNFVEKSSTHYDLNREQKLEILSNVLNYQNFKLLKLACDAFNISNEEKSCFQEFIRDLLHDERISEAAYCISVLNLQNEYPIEELILQLLHNNKWSPAMTFLKGTPDLLLPTAKFLDTLIIKENNSGTISASSRQAYRTLATLVKEFKIPTVECKNLHFIRRKGAINHLVRKRNQKSISETTFEDMVMKIVEDDTSLKEHLLSKLVQYGDKETAVELKEKLQMLDFDLDAVTVLPSVIQNKEVESEEFETEDETLEPDSENDTLRLDLSSSDVKFVASRSCYLQCITDISKNYNMIGIDTEWKPQFGIVEDRLALIQLAVHDKVYILDMLSLNNCLEAEDWDKLMDDVFSNHKIIKLGCSLMTDLHMIVDNNRGSKGRSLRFTHILDMPLFYQKLQEVYPVEMGRDENTRNLIGLSQLCKNILGKPLNKEERLCDWEKRPLTDSQLEYAALDAYCLLQVFDELKKMSLEKNMNFNHLVKVAMIMTSGQSRIKKKLKQEKKKHIDTVNENPIPIHEFRVVVQPELESISKSLKEMGADVLVLQLGDKASDAALIAKIQRRLLICFDDFKTKVENISSDVSCYSMSCDSNNVVELNKILQKANVLTESRKFLHTCQNCNSSDVTQLSTKDLSYFKELESFEDFSNENRLSNNLQRTINEMKQGGVILKFDNQTSISTENVFLCKKCGLVK